uniref:ABC transporter permease n=1 Tax=Nocardia abscessus TaxID=120957 RepID=UPI002458B683
MSTIELRGPANEQLSVAGVLRRNGAETVLSSIATSGRFLRMAVRAVELGALDALRLRFRVGETLAQAWFLLKVTVVPSVLLAIPFGVIVSAQVGNIVSQLGADAMIGAAGGLGVVKQGAPMATALLLGGAGGPGLGGRQGARPRRGVVNARRVVGGGGGVWRGCCPVLAGRGWWGPPRPRSAGRTRRVPVHAGA